MKALFKVYILLFLALLAGCELNEDVLKKEDYAAKIKIRETSLDQLLNEKTFLNAYQKLPAAKETSKTGMETQYGFTIVPNGAKVIENGNKTSYTFKITRAINSADYFENLVINVDSSGQPSAYIVKYTPREAPRPSAHNSFTFTGTIKLTPIVYDVSDTGKDIICHTATVMMCNEPWTTGGSTEPHAATANCNNPNHLFSVTTTTCDVVGGGGSFGAGGGQYTGGNNTGDQTGSGGGGDGEPPADTPTHCPRCPVIITAPVEQQDPTPQSPTTTPCEKLKNLLKQKYVKGTANFLKNKLDENLETVYSLEYNQADKSVSLRPGVSGTRSGRVRVFPTTFGSIHNHPVKQDDGESSFPMFSADDLFTPYLIATSNSNNTGFINDYPVTNIMVTPDNTYALIPNDLQTLTALSAKFTSDKNIMDFNDELQERYEAQGKPWSIEQDKLAKEFLNFVNGKYNLNISIFRISNNNLFGLSPVWTEIIINPDNPNTVKEVPCNQ